MIGSQNNVFVIFGGTGDLTYRKLLPAFYDLVLQGTFNKENFSYNFSYQRIEFVR